MTIKIKVVVQAHLRTEYYDKIPEKIKVMEYSRRIKALFSEARHFYTSDDPAHDVAHVERVMSTCVRLAKDESVDLEILLAAAMLHDVVNLPKDHPERLQASQMAAEKSKALLAGAGFRNAEILWIQTIVTEHSYSLGKKPSSVESALLQDADKLDALGAIGILRAATCGCRLGSSYYDVDDPKAESRDLNDRSFTIDHFFVKLFKLPDLMNTRAGRTEALARVEFMRSFIDELWREIRVELFRG